LATRVVGAVMPLQTPSTNAVRFRNVTLAYERHPVLHHVDLAIPVGSLTAIVGPNGSGKSTLLKAIMGELRPVTGEIQLGQCRQQDIAYLPQLQRIDRSFPINVLDFLLSGMWRECGAFGCLPANALARLDKALAQVGLQGFAQRQIGALSGGQLQRVLFARLLLQDKPLVLLDEPFNAVDQKTAADLIALIKDWHGQARTILVVSHDIEQAKQHFPSAILLARELVSHGASHDVLTASNLLKARQMCEAFQDDADVCHVDVKAA
jgi:zinc/manganese transport system ATP-binding protein